MKVEIEPGMEQLKLLMEYTRFHIGVYITLFTALVTYLRFKRSKRPRKFTGREACGIIAAIVLFFCAGAFGAIIASNIPDYSGFEQFSGELLRVYGCPIGSYSTLAHLEHSCFWLGALVTGVTLVGGYLRGEERSTSSEADRVKGAWSVEREEIPDSVPTIEVFEFNGSRLTQRQRSSDLVHRAEESENITWLFELYPKKTQGTGKDIIRLRRACALHGSRWMTYGECYLGIYELDGDRLKIVYTAKREDLPTSFARIDGTQQRYYELKRR